MDENPQREVFGRLADGTAVERVHLKACGVGLSVLSYGGAIQELAVETSSGPRSVTLGLRTLEDYVQYSPHMGAIAGRYANRIRDGQFSLDGVSYQLTRNEKGRNHLHGGKLGFGRRAWAVEELTGDSVRLTLVSQAGDEGYPGRVEATCTYRISGPLQLSIELTATTDAPTIINLAGHSYFNLSGGGDARDHRLEILADHYLPVDEVQIPTGEIRAVAGTAFDFRTERRVRADVPTRYDHTFVSSMAAIAEPRKMARLTAPDSSLALEVWSTEPGVQFYDGGNVSVPVPGRDGQSYGPFSGLCLEPQRFPDSPNHPGFTNVVLRPGETYRQVTEYRFSTG
ncbi:aldose epimerase family protein [Leptospira interrogans]